MLESTEQREQHGRREARGGLQDAGGNTLKHVFDI